MELSKSSWRAWRFAARSCRHRVVESVRNARRTSDGTFRNECLNEQWYGDLRDAKQSSEDWRVDYVRERPHRQLRDKTPRELALMLGRLQRTQGWPRSLSGVPAPAILKPRTSRER